MTVSRAATVFAFAGIACLLAACGDHAAADTAIAPAPVAAAAEVATTTPAPPDADQARPLREPDVVYVPTPEPVVDAMLNLARVQRDDVLYDLGSGDGRIPIRAAERFGIRATGIEINPDRIREANANAEKAGVTDLVEFREEDLFEADFSDASVVTLYLLDSLNEKLRPRLLAELEPGTRIVSHAFRMGDWAPEQTLEVGDSTIYLWTVPAR